MRNKLATFYLHKFIKYHYYVSLFSVFTPAILNSTKSKAGENLRGVLYGYVASSNFAYYDTFPNRVRLLPSYRDFIRMLKGNCRCRLRVDNLPSYSLFSKSQYTSSSQRPYLAVSILEACTCDERHDIISNLQTRSER